MIVTTYEETALREEAFARKAGAAPHDGAHRMCFIARPVSFPVEHLPTIREEEPST